MGRTLTGMVVLASVAACAPPHRRPSYLDDPPKPRWATLRTVDVRPDRDGRSPGELDLRLELDGEGGGSNPYRVYFMPGRGELWIDIEWSGLSGGGPPVSLQPGSERHVKAVRTEEFAAQNGSEPICRVVVELVNPRATRIDAVRQGQASKWIDVAIRDAGLPDDALLSPYVEEIFRRRGALVLAGAPAAPPPVKRSKKGTRKKAHLTVAPSFEHALARAPVVVIARAESTELGLLDSLPPELVIGANGGFPGGGRITWRVERVVRGRAPELLVLELPVCRPKPPGADCLDVEELRSRSVGSFVLLLSGDSSSPTLADSIEQSIWPADAENQRRLRELAP